MEFLSSNLSDRDYFVLLPHLVMFRVGRFHFLRVCFEIGVRLKIFGNLPTTFFLLSLTIECQSCLMVSQRRFFFSLARFWVSVLPQNCWKKSLKVVTVVVSAESVRPESHRCSLQVRLGLPEGPVHHRHVSLLENRRQTSFQVKLILAASVTTFNFKDRKRFWRRFDKRRRTRFLEFFWFGWRLLCHLVKWFQDSFLVIIGESVD